MTIQEWGAIGELIGGIAVILSLIYVGTQVRQNTNASKLASYRELNDKLINFDLVLATNSELHRITLLAENSRSELTEEEWSRYVHFSLPKLAMWEYAFDESTKADIDEIQWGCFERYFLSCYLAPNTGFRAVYKDHSEIFIESFQQYIAAIDDAH